MKRPRLQIVRGLPGCLPGSTEVMTPSGWIRIDAYKNGTEILQWDHTTGKAHFEVPKEYIVGECSSMLHIRSGRVDMTLTDNHRMPLYNWNGKFVVKPAARVVSHASKYTVPTTWVPSSDGIAMTDAQLRLWVAIAADGHYQKQGFKCEVQVHKDRKAERIERLLHDAGIEYKKTETIRHDRDDAHVRRYYFAKPSHPKHFDWRLAMCSEHQAKVIADELHYWDGTFDTSDCEEFYTSVKMDADIVQYIMHSAGRRTAIREKKFSSNKSTVMRTPWRVCPAKPESPRNKAFIRCDEMRVETVPTDDGKCYCFTTDTTFFVVRQNGFIFITGNSGKSTFAVKNWPHLLRLEFDFFCMRGGEYAFGGKRNTDGQEWLSKLVEDTMIQGLDFVVCGVFAGNAEHLGATVSIALNYGYDVWIKTLDGNFGNTHGVRQQDYDRMVADFLTDDQLELIWLDNPRVRFGTMPNGYVIAPMEDGK